MAIVIGLIELNRSIDSRNLLANAAREGARLATINRDGILAEGQSANEKIANDVKNFLAANGLDPTTVNVSVTEPNSNTPFDLDDPANQLKLFEVRVSADNSAQSPEPIDPADPYANAIYKPSAKVVFRNGAAGMAN
jgi:Flp pilus assembly protein TadG